MSYPWHQAVWQTLQTARLNDRLPHALLLQGELGCGHEEFMQSLAQGFLCLQPDEQGNACGHCRSCQTFVAGAHPDFTQIAVQADKQAIVIDQIRELIYFLSLSRSFSPLRIAMIQEAERLTINAANGLLKSLEEPQANTLIMLFTHQMGSLLPTIRSRCQLIRLPTPLLAESLTWLAQQSLKHDPQALLQQAGNKPLLARELDDSDYGERQQEWLEHLQQLLQGKKTLVELSAYWEPYPKTQLLDWQLVSAHKLLLKHSITDENSSEPLQRLLNPAKLWALYEGLLELKRLAIHPLNSRAMVESMLSLWLETVE